MKRLIAIMAGIFCLTQVHAKDNRPNILWIFTDDHSYQTLGAYGDPRFEGIGITPNMDQMAKGGIRFDRCYVGNSICSPSRATLLTGKHSHKNGKYTNAGRFDHNQQQFQKILSANGYQTVMMGKIHIAGQFQGFDYWEVLSGQGTYNDPFFLLEGGKRVDRKGYTTDIITEQSIDWLKNRRDPNKPFMLMVHHKAPHRNWQPAPRHMDLYQDFDFALPPNFWDDYSNRATAARDQDLSIDKSMSMIGDLKVTADLPPNAQFGNALKRELYTRRNEYFKKHRPTGKELVAWKYQLYIKDYLRCIKAVDESIGDLRDTLTELGLDKNTVVMYASDQGFYMGEHGWFDKRFMYEESFRTPFIVDWPGVTKPGSVNTDLAQNIDFAPTFLDMAGIEVPSDMQGVSLVPLLKGQTPKDWRRSLYYRYYEYPGWHSVKRHEGAFDKRFKLIRYYGKDVENGEEWEFFDLEKDPTEMKSEYNNPEYAAELARMRKELANLREYYDVPEKDDPNMQMSTKPTRPAKKNAAKRKGGKKK